MVYSVSCAWRWRKAVFCGGGFFLACKVIRKGSTNPPPHPPKNTHTHKIAESLCTSIPLFYAKDQSTVAQQAKMTVDKHPLVTNMRTQIQPKHSHLLPNKVGVGWLCCPGELWESIRETSSQAFWRQFTTFVLAVHQCMGAAMFHLGWLSLVVTHQVVSLLPCFTLADLVVIHQVVSQLPCFTLADLVVIHQVVSQLPCLTMADRV